MPARLHIQFAAGVLEEPLAARTGAAARPAHTAARDLERYYALLADELARVTLSDAEATVVIAAARGWVVDPSSYRYLWAEVDDYLRDQVEDRGLAADDEIPRLDAAGRAVLVAKLRALSPGATLALLDAVERYWLISTGAQPLAELGIPTETHARLLREVGLVRDPT